MRTSASLFPVLLLLAASACLKPEPVIYRVSLGMPESKLLQAVGQPVRTTEEDQGRTFEYQSVVRNWRGKDVGTRAWYVHLHDGKVDRFGWRS